MAKMQRDLRVGALAFVLTACMLLSALSPAIIGWDGDSNATGGDVKPDFTYVSIGDSMTNGYGMEGYYAENGDNYSGFLQEVADAYPNMVKNELSEMYDVNLIQLAVSGFRTTELRQLLDEDFPGDIYGNIYGSTKLDDRLEQLNGIVREDGKVDVDGAYASASGYYREMISEADLITYNLGYNDVGTFITGLVGSKLGFSDWSEEQIDVSLGLYLGSEYAGMFDDAMGRINTILVDALVDGGMDAELSGKLVDGVDAIVSAFTYAVIAFVVNHDRTMEAIFELNPDANVIVVDISNAIDSVVFVFEDISIPVGDIYGVFLEAINTYTKYISPYAVKVHHADPVSIPDAFFNELMVGERPSKDARAAIVEHFELADLVDDIPSEGAVDYIYDTVDEDGKLTEMLMDISNFAVIDIMSVIDGVNIDNINEMVKAALTEDRPLTDGEKGLAHIYLRAMVNSGLFAHPDKAGHTTITNAIMDAFETMDEPNEGWLEFYEQYLEGGMPFLESYLCEIYEGLKLKAEVLFDDIEAYISEIMLQNDIDEEGAREVLDMLLSYRAELEGNLAEAKIMLEQGERPSDVIRTVGLDSIVNDVVDELYVMDNGVAKALVTALEMGLFDGFVKTYDLVLGVTIAIEDIIDDLLTYEDDDDSYYQTEEPLYIGGDIYEEFEFILLPIIRLMDIVQIIGGPESDGRVDLDRMDDASDKLVSEIKATDVIVFETDSANLTMLITDITSFISGNVVDLDFTRFSDILGEDVSLWMDDLRGNLDPIMEFLIEKYPTVNDIDDIAFFAIDRLAYTYLGTYQSMVDANDLVKSYNPRATVLFAGAYNRLNGVSFDMDGTLIDIGEVYGMVVDVCNVIIGEYCESVPGTLMVDMSGAVDDTPVTITTDGPSLDYGNLLGKLVYNTDYLEQQVADILAGMREIAPESSVPVEDGSDEVIFDIEDLNSETVVVESEKWDIRIPVSLLDGGQTAKVSLKVMEHGDLPNDIRSFADGKRVISLELHIDGVKRSDFNGNKVTVSVDYVPAEGEDMSDVTVWYMNENEMILDKCENARFDASSNRIIFDTTHFSYWMIGHESPADPEDDDGMNKILFIAIGAVVLAGACIVFLRMKR